MASERARRTGWVLAAALAGLAALIRLPGLFTDFWFDEILSLERFARPARSALDIFFAPAFRHDNNHPLNTLFMYWMGDRDWWVAYRLPAFAAGLGLVVLATWLGDRRSRATAVFTGLAVTCSFMMVVYSTEARGYGPLMLFALLTFLALGNYLDRPDLPRAALFWLWFALGLTAHVAMVQVLLAALFWSGYRLQRNRRALVRLHAVPIALVVGWFSVGLRGVQVGGSDPWAWRTLVDQTLAWTLGFPLGVVPAWVALAATVVLVADDARRLWREGSGEGLFYAAVILGPLVGMAALRPPYLFPRYFILSLLFLLLVVGRTLGRIWHKAGRGRVVAVTAAALFVAGNAVHVRHFVHDDRGHSAAVVQMLAARTATREILIASPSLDDWSVLTARFYERVLHLGDRIRLVPREAPGQPGRAGGVQWIVRPSDVPIVDPPSRLVEAPGEFYGLQAVYGSYGPSGLAWAIYRREEPR